eukprot:TRINITY_DN63086_c0_g1_i2.p1 TRINITY_DN63086_c0_g1~~TRINITY_DN63086_c0_g1_i2.p1  ORF type:complete len:477 (+),score=75.18 TRINITY_DN63086_c0_g1_i2:2-1432(+)
MAENSPNTKLFVSEIPRSATSEDLKSIFNVYGEIQSVFLLRGEGGAHQGRGFVTYTTVEECNNAIENLDGRYTIPPSSTPLTVKFADTKADKQNKRAAWPSSGGRKVFMGQLPPGTSEDQLKQFLATYGTTEKIIMLKTKTPDAAASALVIFTTVEEAQSTISQLHNKFTLYPNGEGPPVQVRLADGEDGTRRPNNDEDENKVRRLFVGMLPQTTEETELRNLFGKFGELTETTIMRNPQGGSKGSAFLRFTTTEASDAAVAELHGTYSVKNATNAMVVKYADTAAERAERTRVKPHNTHTVVQPVTTAVAPAPVGGIPHATRLAFPGLTEQQLAIMQQTYQQMLSNNQYGTVYTTPQYTTYGGYGQPVAVAPQPVTTTSQGRRVGPAGSNLFVAHLDPTDDDDSLAALFQPYGNILSSTVYRDKATGESKCFGFVSFDNAGSAQSAITALNGTTLSNGHTLKVALKNDSPRYKPY